LKDIRRATRPHFSAEDKIRMVLDGLRGDDSIAELCRREDIAQSLYYGLVEGVSRSWQATAGRR
jgi:transposase